MNKMMMTMAAVSAFFTESVMTGNGLFREVYRIPRTKSTGSGRRPNPSRKHRK